MMKQLLLAAALTASVFSAQAAGPNVSISIGDPNFYGSIDFGNRPPPQVIYTHPIIVQPSVEVETAPLYLRVPEEHSRNWRKYCDMYHACGRHVYFVHENWYRQAYVQGNGNEYRGQHDDRWDHDHREGEGRRSDEHEHRDGDHWRHEEHEHREGDGR